MKMNAGVLAIALCCGAASVHGHSWIEKVESTFGEGASRVGMENQSDSYLQRYFCPLPTLSECQPDPKHGIILDDTAMRPCRSDMVSNPMATIPPGTDLTLHWAGNGHVGNGQSDGTCVRIMITPYEDDPSFDDFEDIPDAICLDFDPSKGTIHMPDTVAEGSYTLLWYWGFTEFWYSSCIDIEVSNSATVTNSPAPTPVYEPSDEVDDALIQVYLHNGCGGIDNPDQFCQQYTTIPESTCVDGETDECGRSNCFGIPKFLFPCPENCPVGCPVPQAFYDDFTNGLNEDHWLIAEKSWGSGDGFLNGGVVAENVYPDVSAGTIAFDAHGNFYSGDVMGINKDLTRQTTGVRTGGAIASRRYLGPGSYEIRMKVAGELGVCSALWTFFYNDDDYCNNGDPIVNHEIDIELPGRPTGATDNIDFAQALTNTWTGELGSLHTTGYTPLPVNVDDGAFHTYRFDWHTDTADHKVDFYLDGNHLVTITDNIPFYPGRLWIGAWFPNAWAGEPNFSEAQMEVDYVKFIPFDEPYECLDESYPEFGWTSGTNFEVYERPVCGPNIPTTSPPNTSRAPSSPPQPTSYLNDGCANLPSNFCSNYINSYCKGYASDSCGRSVCQGDSHSSLNPCPAPSPPPTNLPTRGATTSAPTSPPSHQPTHEPSSIIETLVPTHEPTSKPTPTPSHHPTTGEDVNQGVCSNDGTKSCTVDNDCCLFRCTCIMPPFVTSSPTSMPKSKPTHPPSKAAITGTPTRQPTHEPSATAGPNDIYANEGCAVFGGDMDTFCYVFNRGYCKYWQSDGCGRSICKGDSHSNLNPC